MISFYTCCCFCFFTEKIPTPSEANTIINRLTNLLDILISDISFFNNLFMNLINRFGISIIKVNNS